MGAPKRKWTPEEETALRAGVARYGVGKWKDIQKDSEFSSLLSSRSNVDLKDKWKYINNKESLFTRGAPKRKWTPEEETALRAGVAIHGKGKWKAILKDREFSGLLRSRSNVDLKDKWTNIQLFGSQQRGRPAHKQLSVEPSPEVLDNTKQLTVYTEPSPVTSSKKPISRLDDVALEAITNLKEPRGSTRTSISLYIEERYLIPSHYEKLLATNLKRLAENGRLTKVNHRYCLSPSPISSMDSSNTVINGNRTFMKAQTDNDLDKIRVLRAKEAAEAFAKAVTKAEAAIAEAEAATREADNAAYCFAEAARKALNCTNYPRLIN